VGAPIKDVDLLKLSGTVLASPSQPDVTYRLESVIGEGAHGVVFLALQSLPGALSPVVIKLLRPRAVRELAGLAGTAIGKEVAALKRLSERVPPTPFVVQFLDAGTFRLDGSAFDLPWIAVEYIHGGLEGTTLRARVTGALERTGSAFDLERARSAIKCIASGMAAIHEVGVLHRDVTPGNVLCCGFGETEVFKLADFGLARVSSASTFGNVLLGTPGYCAPEQSFPDGVEVGPYTDVFGMACTIYFLLTGQAYFSAPSIPEMLVAVQSPERASLLDARGLSGEIRERRALCLELDRELARATRADPRERQQTTAELAAGILPLLALAPTTALVSTGSVRREARAVPVSAGAASDLRWTVRRQPGGVGALGSIGWDSNGSFLAAGRDGLVYWDGKSFREVPFDWPWVPRVVRRSGAGRWLLAGDHGVLVDFAAGKVEQRVSAGKGVRFVAASGRLDDIVVAAAQPGTDGVELWAFISGRFMEPLPVPDLAEITACAPFGDACWLFVGQARDGAGVALEFRPLGHRYRVLSRVAEGAFCAVASDAEASRALVGGARGQLLGVAGSDVRDLSLPHAEEVGSVALDPLGRHWAATPGKLWTRDESWSVVWSDAGFTSPFVGILADVGRVVAVTSDGAIVQAERAPGFQPA
jgi:eukaryotic-like serine/threonine-protein kinase